MKNNTTPSQNPIIQNIDNHNIESTLNLILGGSLLIQQENENEIQEWVKEPQILSSINSIKQYFDNRPQYQYISKLYRMYCHYPASSTSVERLWSAAGNIIDRKRCSTLPELLLKQVISAFREAKVAQQIWP